MEIKTLYANLLPLVLWPDSKLNEVCEPVVFPDDSWSETNKNLFESSIAQFQADMFCTMNHMKGIGLAAPQVGHPLRMLALEITPGHQDFYVNPEIVEIDNKHKFKWEEGCLSVPGYFESRERPQRIVVSYKTIHNVPQTQELQGLAAFAMQHELDHLNGIVFVDGLSPLKKQRVRDKIRKTLRG